MPRIKYDKTRTNSVDLDILRQGMPGITPPFGSSLAEAATVCLEAAQHRSGVSMLVDGDFKHKVEVYWSGPENSGQAARCWGDSEVATENAAYGIAALLTSEFTDFTVVERSRKGTGFDWWLGKKDSHTPLFQNKARLEVSGIRSGGSRDIQTRLRRKIKQTQRSHTELPGVVTIVEFAAPRSRMKQL